MIQYITDEEGKRSAAIIPIEIFEKLTRYPALAKFLELIPEESGKKNDVIIPREVVTICITKGITLHAAWRVYRKLTQQQVADVLGITQGSVSVMEKSQKPRDINLSRLAEVYNCQPEQLIAVSNEARGTEASQSECVSDRCQMPKQLTTLNGDNGKEVKGM